MGHIQLVVISTVLVALHVAISVGDVNFGRPVLLASTSLSSSPGTTAQASRRSMGTVSSSSAILVHFNRRCTNETKALLSRTAGVHKLLSYIPHDSWLILADPSAARALSHLPGVVFASELAPVHKVSLARILTCLCTALMFLHAHTHAHTHLCASGHAGASFSTH